MSSAVAIAVQEVLAGAPVAWVFEELLEVRQVLWEGIFAGVDAAKLIGNLYDLTRHTASATYKPLALALWRAIWKNDPGARSEVRSQVRKFEHAPAMDWWPNYMETFNQDLQSILKWPDPFWAALHQVAQSPMYPKQLGGD